MQYITEIKYHNVQNDPNTECEHCKLQQPVTKILQRIKLWAHNQDGLEYYAWWKRKDWSVKSHF